MRKVFFYILFIVVCLHGFAVSAQGNATVFEKANQSYKSQDYTKAIQLYESLISSEKNNAWLYYNLGNAFFKIRQLGPAILNYEKAHKINPSDPDISHNLELANAKIVDKVEPLPRFFLFSWVGNLMEKLSSSQWAKLMLLFLWIGVGLIILFLLSGKKRTKKRSFFSGVALLIISTCMSGAAFYQYEKENTSDHAIIFSESITVKSEPNIQSTDLFILHEGLKVAMVSKEGDWVNIKLADGKTGWLPAKVLREI